MPKKTQPKISVLVPCYNVEKYLDECLISIANQTLSDIEIICINDGSTDGTLNVIKKYAKADKRFVVIDKENEGYGKTMNRGLDAATGEYVAIVESDDWIEPHAFETLYKGAKKNKADLAKAEFVFFDNDTRKEWPSWGIGLDPKLYETVFCPTETNPEIIWTGHPSIWTCLYSNKMLRDNNIKFAETPGAAFQDMGFKPKAFAVATRFWYTPTVILHYRKHANNSDKNNNKIYAVCDAHDDTEKWLFTNRPDLADMNKIINRSRFANYVWNLRRLSGEPRELFRQRFQTEFYLYKHKNQLDKSHFDGKSWLKLYTVIYPRNPLWKIMRTLSAVFSPIYKTRIRYGHKVHYLFNVLPVYKQKLAGVKHK